MKVFIGPDSASKRRQIFDLINRGPEVTVITPEQSTLAYESQMIRMLDLPGLIDVQVTSFNHLLKILSRDIYTPKQDSITEIGKKMLFRDILEELSKQLLVFHNIDKDGFYDELESTIDKLMRDDISPAVFEELLADQVEGSLVYNKLSDLHRIYDRFRSRIHEDYFDDDRMIELFERVGHEFNLYSPTEVWLVDFKHLDAKTIRLLRAMQDHTKDICIALSYEADKPWIYPITHETLGLLRDTFDRVEIIALSTPDTPLRRLAEGLHDFSTEPIKAPLRVFAAEDRYEEVEFIGLDILKKLRQDDSLSLDDIRIITSDLESYEFIIKSIFGQFGLAVFSDDRKSIVKNRIVKSIIALMNVYLEGYRRDDVISFLKSYLDEADWEKLDVFENYLIEQGITGKAFKQPFLDDDMEDLRQEFLAQVLSHELDFKQEKDKKKTVADYSDSLLRLFTDLEYPERIEAAAQAYEQRAEQEEMLIITQVWNLLVEALSQLKQVAGHKVVGFRKFKRFFDSSIKDLNVGIIPPAEGRITLATLHRSTHAPCRIMYFCGLNEGLVPKDYLDTGLLKHREKDQIRAFGYRYFDGPEFNQNLDVLDQFIALSMVSDELIFSYAGGNYSKDALSPSLYVNRALGLTGAAIERGLSQHYQEHPGTTFRYAVNAIREDRPEEIHQVTTSELDQIHQAMMTPVITRPIRRPKGNYHASASRLEAFRRCPFNYFVKYDLKPVQRRDYVIENFDIGDLYHLIIQQALEAYQAKRMTRDTIESFVDQAMVDILKLEKYQRFSHTAASRYFVEKAKRISVFVLSILLERIERSDYVPTYFEKTIQVGLDRMNLLGKIDRIDIKDDRFTVIDYKTGSKSFDVNSIYQGIDLQLTLYADAFKEDSNKQPAGLFYFNIKDPIVEEGKDREKNLRLSGITIGDQTGLDNGGDYQFLPAENIPSELMTRLSAHVRQVSQQYVDRIEQGEITIKPVRTHYLNCDYCDYGAICRFDRSRRGFQEDRIEKLKKEEIYQLLLQPELSDDK